MANISFDFSNESIVHPAGKENTPFTYKDIGTGNMRYLEDSITGRASVDDADSSNIDANAVKSALMNILNFRTGDEILNPEFGIGKIYQMLYAPYDKYTTQKMIDTMKSVIFEYEPRIEVTSMPTTYNEDKQVFCITINYIIPALMVNDAVNISLQK